MKNIIAMLMSGLILQSCSVKNNKNMNAMNPLLAEFNTPFNVPPFEKINAGHFLPAYKEAIRQQQIVIDEITNNPEIPSFSNTIEALENSYNLLNEVNNIFENLYEANSNDTLQEVAKEVAPLEAKSTDDIKLNKKLFDRVKPIHEQKDNLTLTEEQQTLLEKTYKNFVRGGAELTPDKQKKLREINEAIALLSVKFGNNVLAETNNFKLIIENTGDLDGLPQNIIDIAYETGKETGNEGKWVFTLDKSSLIPFIQYSEKRELREKLFKAFINKGNNNNEYDNKKIASELASLRQERAMLLGYKNHAGYVLEENMAKNPENVFKLLNQLWQAALPVAKKEAGELQNLINKEGSKFKLEAWDWWYYTEKLRNEKYKLDEEMLRPYLNLESVKNGVFDVARKLYGITFTELNNIPKYHKDVSVFEVKEADGAHIGILYLDFFPRASKRGGAWMSSFRKESKKNGERVPPVVSIVCNFTRPTKDRPALLSFEEVSTFFHEFGHALHGLLSNCTYTSLSGTSVPRDFVELPSQIMENWAAEPTVIQSYAKHYKTGAPIPQELVNKINNSVNFNIGFVTIEYLAAAFLDMNWHTITGTNNMDVTQFESNALNKLGLIPEIIVRYRTPYFNHIFSGEYSSGYYSYVWAEKLDADAFVAFKEAGLFDHATAQAFRKNILERGGSADPMELYVNFRGAEPKIEPLLKRKGLN